jgi:uncharacterized protein
MRFQAVASLTLALLLAPMSQAADTTGSDPQDFAKWKAELTENRKQNWLTLVGLFWLKEGTNRVGGDQNDDVPLPKDKAPAQVGTIDFHGGKAVFTAAPGARVTSDGKPVTSIELQSDMSGKPTVLQLGDLKMLMIQRGQKYGIRVRDVNSAALKDFKGLEFYPFDRNFVVEATFTPEQTPKKVAVPTVLGEDAEMDSMGYAEFTINGHKQRLHALTEGDDELFFIIKDQTAGKETYPAGRFLYTALPKDGKVVIDFNKAHNPPCAFTPYATCPLPPKENYMSVAIEAGEKYEHRNH